ncbi:regulatory protein zeste-like [Drosophila navojoa]|nr:regulatory protein zeste-like [Drosophila navojoa]
MQLAGGTPTFTFSALPNVTAATSVPVPVPVPVSAAAASVANVSASNVAAAATVTQQQQQQQQQPGDSYEERINYFKVKEAELRCKEQQLATEAKKIEVNKAQDELKYMREVHRLRVEELKMKIRILEKEEEQLRKNSTT